MPLPNTPFFQSPTKVSRLYPVLSLVLLLVGSGIIYSWQLTKINSNATVQEQDKKISFLQGQVTSLSAQQKEDQTNLSTQSKQLSTTQGKLSDVQKQLTQATNDLATKEKALSDAEIQLQQQQDQLSNNASELTQLRNRPPLFDFNNQSSLPDATEKEQEIKNTITDAYSYIQDMYGAPYLLDQITITFVSQFDISAASGEITIQNGPNGIAINIHLKDYDNTNFEDVNTLIHEVVHGFHGIAVINNSALEEGETVAATDAIMERMMADGKLPQFPNLYIIIGQDQYNQWNQSLTIPADSTTFYKSPDISQIYQVIGYAWMQMYRSDPDIFKQVNEAYYAQVQQGKTPDRPMILSAIESSLSSVNSIPIAAYVAQNQAFNPR